MFWGKWVHFCEWKCEDPAGRRQGIVETNGLSGTVSFFAILRAKWVSRI
jgi:hypothetical protein